MRDKQNSTFYKGKCIGFSPVQSWRVMGKLRGRIQLAADCDDGIKPPDVTRTWLAGYFPCVVGGANCSRSLALKQEHLGSGARVRIRAGWKTGNDPGLGVGG